MAIVCNFCLAGIFTCKKDASIWSAYWTIRISRIEIIIFLGELIDIRGFD